MNLATVLRVLKEEGEAIDRCASRIASGGASADSLSRALETLAKALSEGGKIVVTGVGKSGKVAQKIAATLSSTGSASIYLHPTEGLHGDLGIVTQKDAVLALSYTGNSDEIIRLIPSLRARKVPVITITGRLDSTLASLSDLTIDAAVEHEACPHNLAPTTSTTLALALGDAIAVALMEARGFQPKDFAENHPGGALGRRLTLKVGDLMAQGEAVGVVTEAASMNDVVGALTRTKLGGVIVVSKSGSRKLSGIITDGDLRRALSHEREFFGLTAKDIMTAKPVMVRAEQMAQEAFDLMENRPNQISVLPVINAAQEWVGLIRLHDLVKTL